MTAQGANRRTLMLTQDCGAKILAGDFRRITSEKPRLPFGPERGVVHLQPGGVGLLLSA